MESKSKKYIYYIPNDVTDEYLIRHYGFKKAIWHDTYNLEYRDKNGLGVQIWYADRSASILLGEHKDYGIAPIPDLLVQMLKDDVIIRKEK